MKAPLNSQSQAFSLVELLIVISIIGIVAGIGVVGISAIDGVVDEAANTRNAQNLTNAYSAALVAGHDFAAGKSTVGEVVDAIRPVAAKGAVIVSILAGTMLDTLRETFPDAGAIVRLMPNLSCALGKSPIALVADELDAARKVDLTEFVGPLGTAEWLDDETLFDLVTALAGSGPGFVYRFIDALAKGATALGLPADQAERLAVATVDGASALAAASEHSAGELARRVASPGGMTQVGLDVMDKDDAILRLMEDTLRGARDRGVQMAEEARKNG